MAEQEQEELYNGNDQEKSENQSTGNSRPVGQTSDGEPVWLNSSRDGDKEYLSIQKENGENVAIFLNDPLFKQAAHERRRQQE